jgi:hypothetical protein
VRWDNFVPAPARRNESPHRRAKARLRDLRCFLTNAVRRKCRSTHARRIYELDRALQPLQTHGCVSAGRLSVSTSQNTALGVAFINGLSVPSSTSNQVEVTTGLRHLRLSFPSRDIAERSGPMGRLASAEVLHCNLPGVMVGTGVRVRQGFEGGGGLAENVACLE